MKFLNLACGAVRPQSEEWINLDSLFQILPFGIPARTNLQNEPNYVEADLRNPLPLPSCEFDGILASHVFEHLTAISCREVVAQCHRCLKTGGVLLVSVPDASYHRQVYKRDVPANTKELFDETIPDSEPKRTFLEYALFFLDHRQVFCEDALWATLVNGGFDSNFVNRISPTETPGDPVLAKMHELLNRRKFSLVMTAQKT